MKRKLKKGKDDADDNKEWKRRRRKKVRNLKVLDHWEFSQLDSFIKDGDKRDQL